jgi:hypothetical protein
LELAREEKRDPALRHFIICELDDRYKKEQKQADRGTNKRLSRGMHAVLKKQRRRT